MNHRIGNLIRDPAELKQRALEFDKLATMLERITRKDIEATSGLLNDAAVDLAYLLKAELVGCPCRRIKDDNYDYLVYDDECRHHRHLKHALELTKKSYKELEVKLKDEVRMKFFVAALAGWGAHCRSAETIVALALEVADAAVAAFIAPKKDP